MERALQCFLGVMLSPLAVMCQALSQAQEVRIPRDAEVQLRLVEGLSTATDHKGYVVHFQLASDLVADGIVVLPAGTPTTARLAISEPGYIQFSDSLLTVAGKTIRLAHQTSAERDEFRAENGAAVGEAIFAAPIIVLALPVQAIIGLHHAIHNDHRKVPQRYVTCDPGDEFKFYVQDTTVVNVAVNNAARP